MAEKFTIKWYRLNHIGITQREMAEMLKKPLVTYQWQENKNAFHGEDFDRFSKLFSIPLNLIEMKRGVKS